MQVCDVKGCWKNSYKAHPVNNGHNHYLFYFCRFMNVRHVKKYSAWNVISSFMTYYTHVLDVLQIIRPSKQWSVEPFLLSSLSFRHSFVLVRGTCVFQGKLSVWAICGAHAWSNTILSAQHHRVYNQAWKVLSSILDWITEWIFERVLLYNFLWSYADVFNRDYLRVCMLISVASSLVYKTRHNG